MGDHRKSFEASLKVLKLGGNLHARLREASRRARRIVGAGPEQRRAAEAQLEAEEKEPKEWSDPEWYDRTDVAIGRCDIEYLVNGEGSKWKDDPGLGNEWHDVIGEVASLGFRTGFESVESNKEKEKAPLGKFIEREGLGLSEFLAGCIFTEHEGKEWKLFVDYLFRRRSRPQPFIILEAEYEKLPLELQGRLKPNRVYMDVTTGHIDDIADVIRKWWKRARASYETLMKPGGEFVPGARMYPGVYVTPAGTRTPVKGAPRNRGETNFFREAVQTVDANPGSRPGLFAEFSDMRPDLSPKDARKTFSKRLSYHRKRLYASPSSR